jgi:hypothetical protein
MHDKVELWTVFIWPVLTGLLNIILRARTPEQWVVLGESHPRIAGCIRFLRAVGLDPAKAVSGLIEITTGKRPE